MYLINLKEEGTAGKVLPMQAQALETMYTECQSCVGVAAHF